MALEEIDKRVREGTVVVNHAQFLLPSIAALAEACTESFGHPCNVNVYSSPPALATSAPPHTDAQDTLILQISGRKHWRVYSPPTRLVAGAQPGKSDPLDLEGLDLVLDEVLGPGETMYVPIGAPHVTSTDAAGSSAQNDTALHLTIGVETTTLKLSSQDLLLCALYVADADFTSAAYLNATRNEPRLRGVLPLGAFLRQPMPTSGSLGVLKQGGVQPWPTHGEGLAEGERWALEVRAHELLQVFGYTGAASPAASGATNVTLDHYRSVLHFVSRMLADAEYNMTRLSSAHRRNQYSRISDGFKFGFRDRCRKLGQALRHTV